MVEKLSLGGLAGKLGSKIGLSKYLENKYLENLAKNCDSLTFPGESRVSSLESLHIPLRFREMGTGSAENAKTIDIWDVLFRSPRLALVAEAGGGKTATLKYVAVVLAQKKMPEAYVRRLTFLHQGEACDELLPIYADLGLFDERYEDLAAFLTPVLAGYGFPDARDYLRAQLKAGRCLLLLDGLNALRSAEKCSHLNRLLSAYPRTQVVIAARPPHAFHGLPGFACFEPLPFSAAEMATYAERRLGKDTPATVALLQAIERNRGLHSIAGNPLLLSTLAAVCARTPQLPLHLRDLYEQCLLTLTVDPTETARTAAFSTSDPYKQALQSLGLYLHEQRQERFKEEELQTAVKQVLLLLGRSADESSLLAMLKDTKLLHLHDDGTYSFIRLAFQEYLAAQAIVAADRLGEVLSNHASEPWWHEVIVNAVALQGDATDAVQRILEAGSSRDEALLLAAHCAIEAPETAQEIKQRLCDDLLRFVESETPALWHEAAVCIAAMKGKRVYDYFPQALREGPALERQRAALIIGRIGTPQWALEPLLGATDKRNPPQVRAQAARGLGQLRDKRAVQTLMSLLKDEQPEVASEAALALSAIGEPAVPSLIPALNSEHAQVRQMAIKALGKMGSLALRPLLTIMQDEKQPDNVIRGAAEALGLLGDAQAIPQLVRLLRSRGGRILEPAAAALAAIGAPAIQPLIDSLPTLSAELQLRQAIVNALVAIGEPAIPALIQALDSSSTAVRDAAKEGLTRLGPPAIEKLLGALHTDDLSLRRRIAEVLEHIGVDEQLLSRLVYMLSDSDPGVRLRVVKMLGDMRQEQGVEPLVNVMQTDPDELVRREAVRSLMSIKSARAVPALIKALEENPHLREYSIAALAAIGDAAVEPLIIAINEGRDAGLQQAGINVLETVGARGRVGEPTPAALARVYSELFVKQPSLDEMVSLLQNIRWWKHGEELYQAFSSAQALAKARSLNEVAEFPKKLAWVDTLENPFRPAIKKILWDLNSVAQNVHLYLQSSARTGQRDAMLSTIDTLTSIQETINSQLLEFEKKPFTDIVMAWRQLAEDAIKSLRGRAKLDIMLMRDDLPLESATATATVVFRLTNVGDSVARNLSVTLKRSGRDGFEVIGPATQELDPLGTGMQRQIEFCIKPLGVTETAFAFEVSYDDDEGKDRFYPFSGRVRFFEVGKEYRPIPSSPYNWGPPIKTSQMFYGRQDVFDWIDQNLSSADALILILHGERRMGKTSILYQLRERPPTPQHACVFFSLELVSASSLGDLLLDMAIAIRDELTKQGVDLPEPSEENFMHNPQRAFRRFYDVVERTLGNRKLLIMIDEFDILIAKVEEGKLSPDTLNFLRGLMQHSSTIAFLCTGAFKVREMLKDNRSVLFNIARPYKISYLNPAEAVELITKPVQDYLFYDDLVVQRILEVSACHPYFIQYICDLLVKQAQRTQKNYVFLPDINVVLQEIIQDNAGVLKNSVYEPLSKPEQKVLAALANVTDERRVYVPPEMVADKLNEYNLGVSKQELLNALHSLRERELVVEQRIGQSLTYGFKMGLIRMWICQNDVLLRLSQEMRI